MPRERRIHYNGAVYHCFARGNNKEDIFTGDHDKNKYLSLIKQYKEVFDYRVIAYALMDNHVHLLIQVGNDPLFKIMQGIQQSYTQYFNKKYERVGHVFQQRYKANLCNTDEYLLTLIKYIHCNPVKAGYTEGLEYKWSSHVDIISDRPRVIDRGVLFDFIGDNFLQSLNKYLNMMNKPSAELEKEYKNAYSHIDKVRSSSIEKEGNESIKLDFQTVLNGILEIYNIDEDELIYKRKKAIQPRRLLVYMCIKFKIISRKELQNYLHIGNSAVTILYYAAMKDETIRGQALIIQ